MRPFVALAAALLALVGVLSWPPSGARADEARFTLVVVDRGVDARKAAAADTARALKIVRALEARGLEVLLLAAGADGDGRLKVTAPTPTQAGLAALDDRRHFGFTGPTDLRGLLGPALVGRSATTPLDLLLVGPFSAPPEDLPARRALGRARAVPNWNEEAPAESRIFPLGVAPAARAVLDDARGLQTRGWLVLGFMRPRADPKPFSPLPFTDGKGVAVLEAQVHAPAEVVPVGAADGPPPLLTAATDLPDSKVTRTTAESLQSFTVSQPLRDGRTATMSFRLVEAEGVTYLCDAPKPLTFTWERLTPDARLLSPEGGLTPVFQALDAEAGKPVVRHFRLLRTRAGSRPAWSAGLAALPDGLRWSVDTETAVGPDVIESALRVEFHARAAHPLDLRGTLELSADGMPASLRLPYVLRVAPGAATFSLTPQPAALPRAAADTPTRLAFVAGNANVPDALLVEAACATDNARWLRGLLRAPDGRETPWPLTQPLALPVGPAHELRFELLAGAPSDELTWPCTLTIRPAPNPGVLTEGEGSLEIRLRRPRIVREGEVFELVVEDGAPQAREPLVLRLDPDGGDGEWLLELLRTAPSVTTLAGDVAGWAVATREPGLWEVRPTGPWRGAEPDTFDDRQADVRLRVAWTGGEGPDDVGATVTIPARWGKRGWLFVVLAALAVLLGITIVVQMRAPLVTGTLLYVVDDMPGTVGRLDLNPVRRRPAAVFADARGRLSLKSGTAMIARIRPTRVGGMLEVVGGSPERERRLLVDGLSVRAGRHMLRYVSGRPAEAEATAAMEDIPDLLGEEFDIESGRIDNL